MKSMCRTWEDILTSFLEFKTPPFHELRYKFRCPAILDTIIIIAKYVSKHIVQTEIKLQTRLKSGLRDRDVSTVSLYTHTEEAFVLVFCLLVYNDLIQSVMCYHVCVR